MLSLSIRFKKIEHIGSIWMIQDCFPNSLGITDIFSELKRCKSNSNLNLFVIFPFSVANFEDFFKLKKNQILFLKTVHTDFRA
jgi:hypothetical protein